MSKKIVVLGTGGTIAGKASHSLDAVGYRAGELGVSHLLQDVPGLRGRLVDETLQAEQLMQFDSKDMTWSAWCAIAQRTSALLMDDEVKAIIVTHGTDTVEETAFFLSQVLPHQFLVKKPVVFACAMRPSSAFAPDGPQNLLDAVAVAETSGACGVVVVCAGMIHAARHVQKIHPYRLNAFDSGEFGALGFVEEGSVRWACDPVQMLRGQDSWGSNVLTSTSIAPRVEIITSHAGATGTMVRMLCMSPPAGEVPLSGIVVAATGNGTIHNDLERALLDAQKQGIRVVRSSRCAYGRVVPARNGLPALEHSDGLSPVKARIALTLELISQHKPH
jgi:L-asparaginase